MTHLILQHMTGEEAYLFLIMMQAFTSDAMPEEVKQMYELPESPFTQKSPTPGFIGLPHIDEALSLKKG